MENHENDLAEERTDTIICGRTIGTDAGWDEADPYALILYSFEPTAALRAQTGMPEHFDLSVDYQNGLLEQYNEDGTEVLRQWDLVKTLALLPTEA